MTEGTRTRHAAVPAAAVVWVDRAHAVTIHVDADGRVSIVSTALPGASAGDEENLALLQVVEAIGDAPRVILLGDPETRTALEREYVAIWHRPERLVEMNLGQKPVPVPAR